MHRFHCENLDSNINSMTYVKREMLHEQVVGYKAVLPELYLHCDPILHEVGLVVGENRSMSRLFDCGFLFRRGEIEGFAYQIIIIRNPVACAAFFPASISKISLEPGVKLYRGVQQLAAHTLFFADLGLVFLCVDGSDNSFDFLPNLWLMNEKPFVSVEVGMQLLDLQGCSERNVSNWMW